MTGHLRSTEKHNQTTDGGKRSASTPACGEAFRRREVCSNASRALDMNQEDMSSNTEEGQGLIRRQRQQRSLLLRAPAPIHHGRFKSGKILRALKHMCAHVMQTQFQAPSVVFRAISGVALNRY